MVRTPTKDQNCSPSARCRGHIRRRSSFSVHIRLRTAKEQYPCYQQRGCRNVDLRCVAQQLATNETLAARHACPDARGDSGAPAHVSNVMDMGYLTDPDAAGLGGLEAERDLPAREGISP